MPLRRSHTKSRKGCLECKRRHVKVGSSNGLALQCQLVPQLPTITQLYPLISGPVVYPLSLKSDIIYSAMNAFQNALCAESANWSAAIPRPAVTGTVLNHPLPQMEQIAMLQRRW
jgi:hypothetical protein